MLGWLTDAYRRWRRNRARNVFRFFDGRRTRAVDPYAVYRFLDCHDKFKWDHLQEVDEDDLAAADITIAAAREAFGLPCYGEGKDELTAAEVLDIVRDFGEFATNAKKKYDRGSTSSPRMDGTSSATTEAHESTTHSYSAAT